MAELVIFGYLFAFLLINTCCASFSALESLDDGSASTLEPSNQLLGNTIPLDKMMVHQPRYKCHLCDPPFCGEPIADYICPNALACIKSSVRASDGTVRYSRGCSTEPDHYQFTCHTHWPNQGNSVRKRHAGQQNVTCCRGDMCNAGPFPALPLAAGPELRPVAAAEWKLWALLAAALLAAAALAATAFLVRRSHRLRLSRAALHKLGADSNYFSSNMYSPHITSAYYEGTEGSQNGGCLVAVAAGDSTLREYLEVSETSGSGSGLPLMVQRTLAKQVSLHECVGKGRFGEVWRGTWYADSVAVKIFFSRDEDCWRRETEMYSTVMLRHENILAYIGSDMTSRGSCTQLWLITHFHPLGSLYEHLGRTTFTRHQMMVICLSIVNGLLHLHTQIHGTQGKPAIAHRDIKSKSILVKVNGECCIGDLGLAVTEQHVRCPPARARAPRHASARYLSPELLDHSMKEDCLESYLRCDVYALGLVVWEVCARTGPAAARERRPPFHGFVPGDRDREPSPHHMRKIVCVEQARPDPPTNRHPTMVGMANLMQECWHQNPSVRLPALRIKKTLLKLAANDNAIHLDEDNEVSV